jgi:hypothetical protein
MRSTLLGIAQTLGIVAAFAGAGLAAGTFYPRAMPERPQQVWLVDGFNVIQVALLAGGERDGWWRDERRAELLARAGRLASAETPVWVAFDGEQPAPEPEPDAPLRAVFAPSADAWLLERLAQEDAACVRLVTADRRLANRARARGAQVVSPRAFLELCPDPA